MESQRNATFCDDISHFGNRHSDVVHHYGGPDRISLENRAIGHIGQGGASCGSWCRNAGIVDRTEK
jgi:hypothetical protein